ncbi:multiple inositol polyphosphate phosphatase 1 isoform X2 [Phoenix dactylifera]|uniref:Multiple inositol polyphosphate phosphatase 1 n=1 Tax=Phoenix dactylifera TaxID=42345 RepID=A0A8B7C5M2_PHODC|nr:multiple inositol polyphosphate phosphatase 1 isoform X2 [Phoenix dactylifera]
MAFAFSSILLALLLAPSLLVRPSAGESFDVRQHLSTVSRYGAAKDPNNANFVPSAIPDGCKAVHLNLVARHGTRSPTKKRIKELDQLAIRLDTLLNDARESQKGSSLEKIPKWLSGWQSPWKGREKGGELISKGEDELYHLGIRVREIFPALFDEEYHPDIFTIRATQVPRASASAVAFGMGLFSGKGSLGPGQHRAFSVLSESRASDICLRFFDTCQTYKEFRSSQEPAVEKLKEPILDEITSSLVTRFQLNFTRRDVASLWFLCKQEASLLEITDQACALFSAYEVSLLEWTDDLEVFVLKGYGKAINYRMGVPLLQEVVQSMEQAIMAKEENRTPATFEKARLRFAHAETLVPFTCLLGLFLEGSEFEQIQREQPLCLPPKPPQKRNWRGSIVAPFSGNNMLALYQCPGNNSSGVMLSGAHRSKYFVHVLHNEIPTPVPGCGNMDFCPFEVFKERVVNPHLKHDFHSVCNVKLELPGAKIEQMKSCSLIFPG